MTSVSVISAEDSIESKPWCLTMPHATCCTTSWAYCTLDGGSDVGCCAGMLRVMMAKPADTVFVSSSYSLACALLAFSLQCNVIFLMLKGQGL